MKSISLVLYIAAIGFCVLGFIGHSVAWAATALSFFAATMMIVGQQKNKRTKDYTNWNFGGLVVMKIFTVHKEDD